MNDKLFTSNPERRLRKVLDKLFNDGINFTDRKNVVVIFAFFTTLLYFYCNQRER